MTVSAHTPSPDQPSGDEVSLEVILRAAAGGDEAAWRNLVSRYSRRVYALVHSRCHDHNLSEELTQDVFATLAAKLDDRYEERGKFEPWLFRIAMNRLRDEMRRRKRHAKPTDPTGFSQLSLVSDDEPSPADQADLGSLRLAVAELSEADRMVVELRHFADMSFAQIAETLAQPIGTVLARHHRALRKLKAIIEEQSNPRTASRAKPRPA